MALLHTTPVTLAAFRELCAQHLPHVRVINLLDDSLLVDVIAQDGVEEPVERRLRAYVEQAKTAGASALMSCCASIGDSLEKIAADAPIPVWRIDEPMAEEAVSRGKRVGVIATVATTLKPTANLVRRKAQERGVEIELESVLVQGAFDALKSGRGGEHDELILKELEGLVHRSDVVVLAQASMGRLQAALPEPAAIPILSSPISGLQRALARLESASCLC
ncbi:MAG: aspartate/glutamate racemase family protein [Terriglobales bacterium]